MLGGKLAAMSAYIGKEERLKINNGSLHVGEQEKEELCTPKANGRKINDKNESRINQT